jgi:hypothetical protein
VGNMLTSSDMLDLAPVIAKKQERMVKMRGEFSVCINSKRYAWEVVLCQISI